MKSKSSNISQMSKIQSVYAERDINSKPSLYSWYRSDVRVQQSEKDLVFSACLAKAFDNNLANVKALDVGCGTGGFLRTLINWGAQPKNLVGTEYLEDRLEVASLRSPSAVEYHLGDLTEFGANSFDLVATNTVFSSILDDVDRLELSREMWRVLKPGGWLLVFDFRYNNPYNTNVRKVTCKELKEYWKESTKSYYKTLLLAPPLARRIIPLSPFLGAFITMLFPFLRSHFCCMLQKPKSE